MESKSIVLFAMALACAGVFGASAAAPAANGEKKTEAPAQVCAVARKLGTCEFLLNGNFKKNAKVYLCLFSASWCPPCRREMPRIAATYADKIQKDPAVELIHFSCDRDEEAARAWAKEHDVKFPVVKAGGRNPLNLNPRGIPHLYILRADGTPIADGHPMQLFTDEKLRELK